MIPLDFLSDLGVLKVYESDNPSIKKVVFNPPATIVFWTDETKTVVKCDKADTYDEYTGMLLCIAKKFFGNTGKYNNILNQYCPEEEKKVAKQENVSIFVSGRIKEQVIDTIHRLTNDALVSACYELNHWRIPQYLSEAIGLPEYLSESFSALPKSVANRTIAPLMNIIHTELVNRYCEQRLLAYGKTLNYKEHEGETTWEEYISEC